VLILYITEFYFKNNSYLQQKLIKKMCIVNEIAKLSSS